MIHIEGTTITMTRGDTLTVQIIMIGENEPYTPQEGDSLRFALKHPKLNGKRTEYVDPEPLIEKQIPTDTQLLRLDPEDTKGLGFGKYVYDIQLTYADGRVDTFIAEAALELTPEVS